MSIVNRTRDRRYTLIAFAAILGAGPATAQPLTRPTIEDLFSVVELNEPQLSPDGGTVVYTVHTFNLAENTSNVDLWRVPVVGGSPVRLTRSPLDDNHPRWRPTGQEVAFLSVRAPDEPKAALYSLDPAGGEPKRLHVHVTSIESFAWSPDGHWIAFTARDEPPQRENAIPGRDVRMEDSAESYTHIWLLDAESGAFRPVTLGRDWTVQSFAWSPDSRSIAFVAKATDQLWDLQSDIYVVQAHDSTTSPRLITTSPGSKWDPVWSPDGRHLVYAGSPGAEVNIGYSQLFRVPAAGGPAQDVSPPRDLEAKAHVYSPSGSGLFFEASNGTTRELFYMPLATRVPVRITSGRGVSRAGHLSRDGRRAVFLRESPEMPTEVYTAALSQSPAPGSLGAAARLTYHNQHAAALAVGRTEVVRWRSTDGREVEGLVVHRPGAARPGPLVVDIHGGPSDAWVQNFQAASPWAKAHLFAAVGYTVLLPNPRGSHGYGDAVQRMADWGQRDYQDIMTGVDALIGRGLAHPDSMAVMGWSYGGFMTAWAITQSTRFKAAVIGAGITEPIAMWGMQDDVFYYEAFFGGGPFAEGAWSKYQRSSPLAGVGRVRTPTLILHGTDDRTVPAGQARLFYRALRAHDVPAVLAWLPGTEHGPTTPGMGYEMVHRQKDWIDRWVRGQRAVPAPATQP